ncbi:SLAP domain-containing protein [Companilactobacillus keshanensis]|uniref:SLAP domain-containing protein n=1 Tax=Companilactobacillus keshanensis TaxID=2486003 RepID=A0ABW4BXB6_9LACO|nr:SLAP domain-containing protein [Companilactobacillus keshanensis]
MKRKTIVILMLTVLLTLSFSSLTNVAKAESVTQPGYDAEVTSSTSATLYNSSGDVLKYGLAHGSDWKVGSTLNINGTDYYEVSTGAYLSSKDSYLYQNRLEIIRDDMDSSTPVYTYNFKQVSDVALKPDTYWLSDRIIYSGSIPYVRVSTDEFVCMTDVTQESFTEYL